MAVRCLALVLLFLVFPACSASDSTGTGDGGPGSVDGGGTTDDLGVGMDGAGRWDIAPLDVTRRDGPSSGVDVALPPVGTQRFACTDCPATVFPPPTAPSCGDSAASRPVLVYPPDGVLLPPNLNVMEVQFYPGQGNTLWEVDFTNGVTDVRATTHCSAITSVRGRATGVCGFTLPQTVWDALVLPNRGREPVRITVRGTTAANNCTATATATRAIRFGFEDLAGGIYYWQSAVFGGTPGRTGGIYLHDFGSRATTDTAYLESGTTGRCTGCHNLSRDGARMSVGQDDPDADDEFRDVTTTMLQVSDHSTLGPGGRTIPAGFQTFSHDHRYMLTSDFVYGRGGGDTQFLLFDGNAGTQVRAVPIPGVPVGTQPDWSADDRHVVFVSPRMGTIASQGDHHFHGGDLYTMDVDPTFAFGTPRVLLPGTLPGEPPSTDNANYYPSYSPDGQFLIFNHAQQGDIFYNRGAEVVLATSAGHNPTALTNLNGGANLTNSWPRWSPYVQGYGLGHILWVTFSSNRNYGVRVENDGQPNCYPPSSPAEDTPQSTNWSNCAQPQIWMAAVGVDVDEFGMGRDTSYPAFWLPFQNVGSHNHSAQWVAQVVTHTCVPSGGACPGPGGTDCCAGTTCDPTSHTCVVPCVPMNGVCPGPGGAMCCAGLPCDSVTHTCARGPG